MHSDAGLKPKQWAALQDFRKGIHYNATFVIHLYADIFVSFDNFHSLENVEQFALVGCQLLSKMEMRDPEKCVLYASLALAPTGTATAIASRMGQRSFLGFSGEYTRTQKIGQYGAFAISGMAEDGYSWGYSSEEEAVDIAISYCEAEATRAIAGFSSAAREAIIEEGLVECSVVHVTHP